MKLFDQLFLLSAKHREAIITLFKLTYVLLIGLSVLGGRSLYYGDAAALRFYEFAGTAGELAVVVYILTIIPGIARRFRISHKLIALLMMYRRYLGIMMFLLVWVHFWFERGVDWFFRSIPLLPQTFEIFGILAGTVLLAMALTSNDISTKRLGVWWGRLHALTYTLVWFIFLHIILVTVNIWGILIGFAGVLVMSSHVFARFKR